MIFPGGEIDYKVIVNSFIKDKAFSSIIWENIEFVEKYLPMVEEKFQCESEKRIVYRELAVIVYSCIEAVLKSVVVNINEHCKDCQEVCEYGKYTDPKKFRNLYAITAFRYLINTNFIQFFSREKYEFRVLNDLRNNVHLSKNIGIEKPFIDFDKDFVKRTCSYFYGILAQLSFRKVYFEDNSICLKKNDGDKIGTRTKQNEQEEEFYNFFSLTAALNLLFLGVKLQRSEEWTLRTINEKASPKAMASSIHFIFSMSAQHFHSDCDYQKALDNYFSELSKYLSIDYLNNVRSSYNEISETYGDKR